MKVLILDTETTGLPDYKNTLMKTPKWYTVYPDIVQLSWFMYDSKTLQQIDMQDFIIDIGCDIPEESTKIHGITTQIMRTQGVKFSDVIPILIDSLKKADVLVCHNLEFDKKMVVSNMMKHGCINIFDVLRLQEFCTMKNSIDICCIKRRNMKTGMIGNKYPRLNELHKHYFGYIPNGLHNSMVDVLCTLRCYHKMLRGVDLMEDINYKDLMQCLIKK